MVINWQDYFMGIAVLSSYRSKDPNTQVGACIVNPLNRVVGIGYNGMPQGCDDNIFPWDKNSDNNSLNKYLYVVHAELNAILNSTVQLFDCTMYTTLFPCNECCKAIIQSGIKHIIYLSDKYKCEDSTIASKRMMDAAKISYQVHRTIQKSITLNLTL